MSGQQDLAWETQDGVRSLQAALNSQPPVPMPLASWDTNTNSIPKLEGLDTIDLSTAPLMRSSPPVARPTILPQRSLVVTHPYSTPMGETVPQSHNVPQYVNLDGELLSQSPHSGKRVRVKSREKSGETGEVRPCRVCGERAGKHSYYGGQVCPSCRAFFRRSVQSGYNATYYCVKEGACEVTLKTRKNCQYCRYMLCENAGMKTSWVLTEEERKLKFAGKGKKRKDRVPSSVSQSDCSEVQDPGPGTMPVLELCETDLADIRSYVNMSGCYEPSRVTDMDTQLIRKIIRMIAFRASLDQEGQQQLRGVIFNRCHKLVTRLQEFSRLCPADRSVLVNSNLSLVTILTTCSMFPLHLQWTMQLSPLLGELEVEKLDTKLRSLNVTGIDNLHLDYGQFFTVQASEGESERLVKLINNIGSWQQDPTELVLLSLVIFFSADMLELRDRPTVEQIQIKLVLLLQKYINIRHQSELEVSRQRFAKAMMMVTLCREMLELQNTLKNSHHL